MRPASCFDGYKFNSDGLVSSLIRIANFNMSDRRHSQPHSFTELANSNPNLTRNAIFEFNSYSHFWIENIE